MASSHPTAAQLIDQLRDMMQVDDPDENDKPQSVTTTTGDAPDVLNPWIELFNQLDVYCDISFFEEYNRVMGGSLVAKHQTHTDLMECSGSKSTDYQRADPLLTSTPVSITPRSGLFHTNVMSTNVGNLAFAADGGACMRTTAPFVADAMIGFIRIGFVTDGRSRLYYYDGNEFIAVPASILVKKEDGTYSPAQRIVHRIVAMGMKNRGWYTAPCYHLIKPRGAPSGADMLGSLGANIAAYATYPGSVKMMLQMAQECNYLASGIDYVRFLNLVQRNVHDKANAVFGFHKQSSMHVLICAKDLPNAGEVILNAGPALGPFWAILAYECASDAKAIKTFGTYEAFWKRITSFERGRLDALNTSFSSSSAK